MAASDVAGINPGTVWRVIKARTPLPGDKSLWLLDVYFKDPTVNPLRFLYLSEVERNTAYDEMVNSIRSAGLSARFFGPDGLIKPA